MKRTTFMQLLLTVTYPNVAIEAIKGGFDGSWERLIAKKLQEKVAAGHSEAEVIVQAAGGDFFKAATLITSSIIQP